MTNLPQTPFYFIRHGQTDWNAQRILQGWSDIELNAEGIRQAEEAAQKLELITFDMIVASPLKRAAKTAEIIAQRTGKPITFCEGLKERNFGEAEGKPIEESAEKYHWHKHPMAQIPIPDAEPFEDLVKRAVASVDWLMAQHAGQTLLLVGHGAFFRGLCEGLLPPEACFRLANATPMRFAPEGAGWVVEEIA
jgi:broad specificity phosphatase PhoE